MRLFFLFRSLWQSAPAATPQTTADDCPVLQKIVVKGKRAAPGSVADTPLASEVTAKQLQEKQVTDYNVIGRRVDAGVNYWRADAGFNLRGLSCARILTTIDGIPIPYVSNSSRQGAFAPANAKGGGDTFDFNSLSSLDIVPGADSSKGGSGMLGGAVGSQYAGTGGFSFLKAVTGVRSSNRPMTAKTGAFPARLPLPRRSAAPRSCSRAATAKAMNATSSTRNIQRARRARRQSQLGDHVAAARLVFRAWPYYKVSLTKTF
ncbi:outer membrane receptor protein involved in Fe transport [Rhizobium binae]|uniref:Outer membrane receptor protein involved in Fe transport n=1 Tax=Rhizobium binae TaxID=1138190 RepID=A0ABV2MBH0_9HYPH